MKAQNEKSYNKIDCVGILVRRSNTKARFFRFKTPQRRQDAKAVYDRLSRKYALTYGYCQTDKGSIF